MEPYGTLWNPMEPKFPGKPQGAPREPPREPLGPLGAPWGFFWGPLEPLVLPVWLSQEPPALVTTCGVPPGGPLGRSWVPLGDLLGSLGAQVSLLGSS